MNEIRIDMVLYDVVSGSPPQVDTDIHKIFVFHGRRGCEAIVSYHLKTVMAKDNLETRRVPCGASCIMHHAQCRDVDFPQILATRLRFDLNYHVRLAGYFLRFAPEDASVSSTKHDSAPESLLL